MKKRLLSAAVVVCLSAGLLQGCRIGNTEYVWDTRVKSNDFVFTINESGCGEKEARLYLCNYKNLYGNDYGIDLWKYEFEDASIKDYVKDVTLDELVRITSMDMIAQEQEMELDEDELSKVKKAAEEYYESLTDEEREFIGAQKSDISSFYEHYALAMKLYHSLTDDVNEEVSDDDARVVRFQQILVNTDKEAMEVAQKLSQGDDFVSVASAYNQAEEDEVTAARGELPQELETVVFELNDNEIANRISTSDGFYFVKCISKNDEQLTEANKEVIRQAREEEQFNQVYTSFNKEAVYALNEDIWSNVSIDEDVTITTDSFFDVYEKYFK